MINSLAYINPEGLNKLKLNLDNLIPWTDHINLPKFIFPIYYQIYLGLKLGESIKILFILLTSLYHV